MIKINLLTPEKTKKTKKKVQMESQLIWLGLAAVLLVVAWYAGWSVLDDSVERLNADKVRLTQELAQLKVQVKEVENFEADKLKAQEKIQVIQQLRKNQSIPVYLLDEISKRLPDRVWLMSLREQSGTVELTGQATTNHEIVDFINNLKEASAFQDIQIVESRQNKEQNITVYSFRLKWSILS